MFCTNCGHENAEGAKFCPNCGKEFVKVPVAEEIEETTAPEAKEEIVQQKAVEETVQEPAEKAQEAKAVSEQTQNSMPGADSVVKKIARSPLFLITIVLFTASFLISLFETFSILNSFSHFGNFVDFGINYGYGYSFNPMSTISSVLYVVAVIAFIPAVLTCVGLWITYAQGFKKGRMGTAGLTIIGVINTISLVFVCIAAAFTEIIFIIGMINSRFDQEKEVLFLMLLLFGIIYSLIIIYYVKINKTINSAKYSINTGKPSMYASTYVAVMNIIGAAVSIISLIFTFAVKNALIEAFYYMSYEMAMIYNSLMRVSPISVFSILSSISMQILFACLIFVYKSKMEKYTYNAR